MTLTERWLRLYTAGVPEPARSRRREEVRCDVHDQLAEAASRRRGRVAVAGRTVRGAVDDLVWRREVVRGMERTRVRSALTQAWWAPFAGLVLLFDIGFAGAVLADDNSTMPGRVVGPALVLLAATAMAVGLTVRMGRASTASAGGTRIAAGAVLLAVLAALTLGGPVVLVLAAVVCVLAVSVLLRGRVGAGGAADGLVLVGTLPALAMFWLVVPALLAIAVIVGVLSGRTRTAVAPA